MEIEGESSQNVNDNNRENKFQIEFEDFINFQPLEDEQAYDDSSDDEHIGISDSSANFLTDEEQKTINMCDDPELKELLLLNRSKNFRLNKLYKNINNLLKLCRKNIHEQNMAIVRSTLEPKRIRTNSWKLGTPYFKDADFFPCPFNEEVKSRKSSGELLPIDIGKQKKWRKLECDNLINGVAILYNIGKQKEIIQRLVKLKSKYEDMQDGVEKQEISEEIQVLENQLEDLKQSNRKDDVPPLNNDHCMDWYKLVDSFVGKRTPEECKVMWNIYLHPKLNKSPWSNEENQKLQEIVNKYSYQNWDVIAEELNTNRSAFLTCFHYYRNICDKFLRTRFTSEEDKLILNLVNIYRVGVFIPWQIVTAFVPGRSQFQISRRYTYYLSKTVKKGKFSEAEDVLLLILVGKFGKKFRKCAEHMKSRTFVQLKDRYVSHWERAIKKGTFTKSEDAEILEHVEKFGEANWGPLSKKLNRNRNSLRQRYNYIKVYVEFHPDFCLEDIPKRRHKILESKQSNSDFLRCVAAKFKDCKTIPSLEMIEEYLDVNKGDSSAVTRATKPRKEINSYKRNIDTLLTNYFAHSFKIKQNKIVNYQNLDVATSHINHILQVLQANLKIPETFEDISQLDEIDKIILTKISIISNSDSSLIKFIPPNINTLLGLRSLLIQNSEFKETSTGDNLLSCLDEDANVIDKNLFLRRFNSLFQWSSILTLHKPCFKESTVENELSCSNSQRPPAKRRKIEINIQNDVLKQTIPMPETNSNVFD